MDHVIARAALWVVPVLFAITLHEVAHGFVARYFGDPTAERQGRLTLNPLHHIDPIGTVLIPAVLYFTTQGAFTFGWAKPVPVNIFALRHPKRDTMWVALAGPMANLAMALSWAMVMGVAYRFFGGEYGQSLQLMAAAGLVVNVSMMIFNLLPIPPLDGGRVLTGLLPDALAIQFVKLEPYGMFILVAVLATHLLDGFLGKMNAVVIETIAGLFIS